MARQRIDQITVKIDPALREALERAAEADHRTVSGMVRWLIAQALENGAARPPPPQEAA